MSQLVRMTCAAVAALIAAASFVACSQTTGPSLTVSIEGRRIEPSSTLTPASLASSTCCCRIRGTIRNTSSIPVFVELRFWYQQPDGTRIWSTTWDRVPGTVLAWYSNPGVPADSSPANIAPGAAVAFDSPGFLVPCNQLNSTLVNNDPLVFAIYSLPN